MQNSISDKNVSIFCFNIGSIAYPICSPISLPLQKNFYVGVPSTDIRSINSLLFLSSTINFRKTNLFLYCSDKLLYDGSKA